MKQFLYSFLLVSITSSGSAQNLISPKSLAHLNNSNLRSLQSLLLTWKCPRFNREDAWGSEPWEQTIKVDEKSQQLFYKIRDIAENSTDTNWMYTFYIPILLIDSVTQNYNDSTLTFYTPKGKIDIWQLSYPALKDEKVSMHMQLWKVRNLAGQIWGNIRKYQLKINNKN